MESFRCIRLSILAEAENHISLPAYQGSTLRGAFGHALRRTVCALKQEQCDNCLLREKCVYSYIFETPVPDEEGHCRRYPNAPHPFVFNPMTNGEGRHHPGNRLRFGVTLVGRAIDYLPYFVYAFMQMGDIGLGKGRGRFVVKKIETLDPRGRPMETLFTGDLLKSPDTPLIYQQALTLAETLPSDRISLSFRTPLRVKYRGKYRDDPQFHILVRNLLRRIADLIRFHCADQEPDIPFKDLIRKAQDIQIHEKQTRWYDWTRYSNRQHRKIKMGGVVGRVTYAGDMMEFLPYLILGSWVNVGKGTSFGLGSYVLKQALSR